jgi:hypothetical protein
MANKPNNPSLWSKAKSMAKQKYDVYPSAYSNAAAAKWYKSKGGTWRSKAKESEYIRHMYKESGNYNDCPSGQYRHPVTGECVYAYSWGQSAPTQVVNTTGSGHSQTIPSTYKPTVGMKKPFQGDLTKITQELPEGVSGSGQSNFEKILQAGDKAIGQYLVQPTIELVNTPFATFAEGVNAIQGKEYDFNRALPNPARMVANAQWEGDPNIPNQQYLSDYLGVDREKNPYLAMGLDVFTPGPAMFIKPIKSSFNVIKQMKLPSTIKSFKFKPQVSSDKDLSLSYAIEDEIDYVKRLTSDPRYAQKAKEIDIKYRSPIDDSKIQLRTTPDDQTFQNEVRKQPYRSSEPQPSKPDMRGQELIDYNEVERYLDNFTKESPDHIGKLKYLREQRNNPFFQYSIMSPQSVKKASPMSISTPFSDMAMYTQNPNFYKDINQVDLAQDYITEIIKNNKPYNFEEVERLERIGGDYQPYSERIRIQKRGALPHELKHREHHMGKWKAQFPNKYKQKMFNNFDNSGTLDDYTKYRLLPEEQEAWLSRDLKRDMVRRGILKDPFEHIDEAKFDNWLKLDQTGRSNALSSIFTPELIKRLNKPNFLQWVNDALPMMTGIGGTGLGTYLLGKSMQQPKQKYQTSGMIKRDNGSYALGGTVDTGCPDGMVKDPITGECVYLYLTSDKNDPRLQSYQDSSDVYNFSKQQKRFFPNTPEISKEKYDEILKKESNLDFWEFDEAQYKEDKKNNKNTYNLENYLYARKYHDYEHPKYKKNNPNLLNYTDNIDDYAITLKDGTIKKPTLVYNNKPDFSSYTIYNPKTGTERYYSDNRLLSVFNDNIKPENKYYGLDKPIEGYSMDLSEYENNKLLNNKKYTNYYYQKENVLNYKAPIVRVQYDPKAPVRVPVMPVEETRKMMDNFAKERKEKEDYAAYEKWRTENPILEPEPRINDEMEIMYGKPIYMPTKLLGYIPTNEIMPNINTGIKYQKESNEGAYPMMMSNEGQGRINKKGKRKYQNSGIFIKPKQKY